MYTTKMQNNPLVVFQVFLETSIACQWYKNSANLRAAIYKIVSGLQDQIWIFDM